MLIVHPLMELKENVAGVNEPVPEKSAPVTVLDPPLEEEELSTVITQVRTFAVWDVVPANAMPVRV
jgi:hypothetical protein